MSGNTEKIVRRTIARTRLLTGIACAALLVALIAQLVLRTDWHGLPFLGFAAAMAVIVILHFSVWRHLPEGNA